MVKDTAFDRFLLGDDHAISDEAKEGMKLFVGKAGCITCHAGQWLDFHMMKYDVSSAMTW